MNPLLTQLENALAQADYQLSLNLWQIEQFDGNWQHAVQEIIDEQVEIKILKRLDEFKIQNRVREKLLSHVHEEQMDNAEALIVELFKQLSLTRFDQIHEFEFVAGHPGKPIHWQFNYLIKQGSNAMIFCGEASD